MSATKFFIDNLNRLNPQANPLEWNLNQGLAAIAKQLDEIQTRQRSMEQEVHRVKQIVQQLR